MFWTIPSQAGCAELFASDIVSALFFSKPMTPTDSRVNSSDDEDNITTLGQASVLIDLFLPSPIGRYTLIILSVLSDQMKKKVRSRLESQILIAESQEAVVRLDQGTDPPDWEFEIPVDNRSPDQIELVGIDLVFGQKRWRRQFGDIFWNKELGIPDPLFIRTHPIEPNSRETIEFYHTPPIWVYNTRKPFTIRVVGSIIYSTSFGQVKLPVRTSVRITEEMVDKYFPEAAKEFDRKFRESGDLV